MAGGTARYRIQWRQQANEDLRGIVRYIGRDNPARAREFAREFRAKVKQLEQHPGLGRSARPGLPPGIRELVAHRNYIVFYRVQEADRTIDILRVKHAAQRML